MIYRNYQNCRTCLRCSSKV